ncbi:MAG: hypothetical protein AAB546_04510 [Patescibacteria group bacterium]
MLERNSFDISQVSIQDIKLNKDLRNLIFTNQQLTIQYLAIRIVNNGVFNVPRATDDEEFQKCIGLSVSFFENKREMRNGLRVEDLLDMAQCLAKGVDYISRQTYRSLKTPDELLFLMTRRAFQLRVSEYLLYPTSRQPGEVVKVFRENYGISPGEVNIILKNMESSGNTKGAIALDMQAREDSFQRYKIFTGIKERLAIKQSQHLFR